MIAALVSQHKDLPGLLSTIFSWLHERSDLYVVDTNPKRPIGFAPGEAERLLLRAFTSFPYKPPPAAAPAPAPARPPCAPTATSAAAPCHVRYTGEGKQIPVASGGVGPGYWWEQTLTTASLYALLPAGTPSRAVECALSSGGRHLRLALKGAPAPIIDADLPYAIKRGEDELVWNLETPDAPPPMRTDPLHACHVAPPGCGLGEGGSGAAAGAAAAGRVFSLFLEKTVHTWWRSFTVGGPEIDAQRVDSTLPISEYDEETQQAIRKVMAEQADKRAVGRGGGGGGGGGEGGGPAEPL